MSTSKDHKQPSFANNLLIAGAVMFASGALMYRGGQETARLLFSLYGAIICWCVLNKHTLHTYKLTAIGWSLIAYFVLAFASCSWSLIPAVSFEVATAVGFPAYSYFLTRSSIAAGITTSSILSIVTSAGIFAAVATIIEFSVTTSRPSGIFLDFNANAGFISGVLIVNLAKTLSLLLKNKNYKNSTLEIAKYLTLITSFVLTESLSGLLMFLVGMTFLMIFSGLKKIETWKIAGPAIAFVIVGYSLFSLLNHNITEDPFHKLATLENHPSFSSRLSMYESTIKIYVDNAPLGVGLGMYKTVYPRYRDPSEKFSTGDLAHNDYLEFLAEGGLLLLLIPVIWIILLIGYGFIIIFRERKSNSVLLGGYLAACVAFLFQASMNFVLYVTSISATLGVYLALLDTGFNPVKAPEHISSNNIFRKFLIASTILLITVTLGLRSVFLLPETDPNCDLRLCQKIKHDPNKRLQLANLIASTQPTWVPARIFIIEQYRREATTAANNATAVYLQNLVELEIADIIKVLPKLSVGYEMLAQSIENLSIKDPDYKNHVQDLSIVYETALNLDPTDVNIRLKYFDYLIKNNDKTKAYDILIDTKIDSPKSYAATQNDYVALLTAATAIAVDLGRCRKAAIFAKEAISLNSSARVDHRILDISSQNKLELTGCGIS